MNMGEPALGLLHRPGYQGKSACFAGTDGNLSGNGFIGRLKFHLGFFHQGNDFFRALSEPHAVFRQHGFPVGADKKFPAEFCLQIRHLPGKGGLGNVQNVGGVCHIFLTGDGKKIP